ncbi:MAG: response regulator transcription factor [Chloroflexi bacterium]|nr:response regulator transcription factor [Chloroflexota bacterium]MCH8349812.1 response regulator transcription factor [Chloroflexota bacterium]MCI0780252.1 response regulator transcription factor [Chloroflexota bacterium]MCI0785588.1 response regulator transcription factor [Chloroflexota bacterium]MCI0792855.1 response regulator transcription factor [Chloroflexota bacterium]
MTSIVLADDHTIVRQGLRLLLEAEPDFSIVGEASDGLEVAGLVDRLRPDVLVLDLMMPGISGLEVTRNVCQQFPETSVVILSMHADESYVLAALKNGAAAYVLKDAGADDLLQAVREVVQGRRYLSSPFSQVGIDTYTKRAESTPLDVYDTLTSREREVLHLTAEGYSSADVSGVLSISPRTAEAHRANLMRKLGFHSQADLIRYALRRGIISIEA